MEGGLYQDWRPARWAARLRMDRRLPVAGGRVTVSSPGIYLLYAQVSRTSCPPATHSVQLTFRDPGAVTAFNLLVNSEPLLQCSGVGNSSCYTGAATFLEQGDTVGLASVSRARAELLPQHSFFGLVQLADMRPG